MIDQKWQVVFHDMEQRKCITKAFQQTLEHCGKVGLPFQSRAALA